MFVPKKGIFMKLNITNNVNECDNRKWVYRDIYYWRGKGKESIKLSKLIEKKFRKFEKFIEKNQFYLILLLSTLDVEKGSNKELRICYNSKKILEYSDIVDLYKFLNK